MKIGEPCVCILELDNFSTLTDFSVEIKVDTNEYFYINNEIWQCQIFITRRTNIFPMTKVENSSVEMQWSVKCVTWFCMTITFRKVLVKVGGRIKDEYPHLAQMLLGYFSLLGPHVWVWPCILYMHDQNNVLQQTEFRSTYEFQTVFR